MAADPQNKNPENAEIQLFIKTMNTLKTTTHSRPGTEQNLQWLWSQPYKTTPENAIKPMNT